MKKFILNIILALVLGFAFGCHAGTDILPNPSAPGNLGSVSAPFPHLYSTDVHAGDVTYSDGSIQTSAVNIITNGLNVINVAANHVISSTETNYMTTNGVLFAVNTQPGAVQLTLPPAFPNQFQVINLSTNQIIYTNGVGVTFLVPNSSSAPIYQNSYTNSYPMKVVRFAMLNSSNVVVIDERITGAEINTLAAASIGPGSNLVSRAAGSSKLLDIPAGITFLGNFAGTVELGTNSSSPYNHRLTNDLSGTLHEQHTLDGATWVDDLTLNITGIETVKEIDPLAGGGLTINLGAGSVGAGLDIFSTSGFSTFTCSMTDSGISGPGSGITSLNASAISSGTVPPANLPVATTSAFGAMKPDGTTITSAGGVMSAVGGGSAVGNIPFSDWAVGSSTTVMTGYPAAPIAAAVATLYSVNTDLQGFTYTTAASTSATNYLVDSVQGMYTPTGGSVTWMLAITNISNVNYRFCIYHAGNIATFATTDGPTAFAFDGAWLDSGLVNVALETCNGSGITTNISTIPIYTLTNNDSLLNLTYTPSNVILYVNGVAAATNTTTLMTNICEKVATVKTYDGAAKGFRIYHAFSK